MTFTILVAVTGVGALLKQVRRYVDCVVTVSENVFATRREAFDARVFKSTLFFLMVQEFTFSALEVMVTVPFFSTRFGVTVNSVILGTRTEIVTVCVVEPPGPVQVIEYTAGSGPGGLTVALEPVEPLVEKPPAATHDAALLEFHVSVTCSPLSIVFLSEVNETVGGHAWTLQL